MRALGLTPLGRYEQEIISRSRATGHAPVQLPAITSDLRAIPERTCDALRGTEKRSILEQGRARSRAARIINTAGDLYTILISSHVFLMPH